MGRHYYWSIVSTCIFPPNFTGERHRLRLDWGRGREYTNPTSGDNPGISRSIPKCVCLHMLIWGIWKKLTFMSRLYADVRPMYVHTVHHRDRDRSAPSRCTRPQSQMVNPNARNPECGCLKPHGDDETCGFSLINKFVLRTPWFHGYSSFLPNRNRFYVRFACLSTIEIPNRHNPIPF